MRFDFGFLYRFHLSYTGNEIRPEGIKAISNLLKSSTSLTKLNVSFICDNYAINSFLFDSFSTGNQVRDDGAKFIAEALKENTALTQLGLDMMETKSVS